MRINGTYTEHNEYMTWSQIEYLKGRAESLARTLERKGYDVSLDRSGKSEALYLTIEGQEISIRNHGFYGDNNPKDYTVWLRDFEMWTDAKKHIMNNIIPELPAPSEEPKKKERSQIDDFQLQLLKEDVANLQASIETIRKQGGNPASLEEMLAEKEKELEGAQ